MATPGRQFFDKQLEYLSANKIDELIDNQYASDAVLISAFNVLPSPPPHVVRGNKALKEFFRAYVDWHGSINVEELTNFVEIEKSIFFQAVFTSKTGRWAAGDAWHMRDGQIEVHYAFAHKIG